MTALREIFRLLHLGRQHLSVAHCERDIERAKSDLAKALAARDAALADIRIAEAPPRRIPTFLLIQNPAPPARRKRA